MSYGFDSQNETPDATCRATSHGKRILMTERERQCFAKLIKADIEN
jgi:hypothetical protein